MKLTDEGNINPADEKSTTLTYNGNGTMFIFELVVDELRRVICYFVEMIHMINTLSEN